MQWYYSKNNTQLGPVSQDELRAKLASGEVSQSDMVWREGMTDWQPASGMAELAVMPAGAPPLPGAAPSPYAPPAMAAGQAGAVIPNYLWQSIVVTIFCCWPLGIPAIVYAAKVDGMKARGDIQGAMAASANAKKWCWISLIGWVVVIGLYAAFVAIMMVSGAASGNH